jgi:hypothetical protein
MIKRSCLLAKASTVASHGADGDLAECTWHGPLSAPNAGCMALSRGSSRAHDGWERLP